MELRLQLENHIHKGIAQLIQENKNKVTRSIYQEDKLKNEPSQ
jgi:predicted transcriptional regulator